jgi:tetratricopeptide (TPR) repeat protein
VHRTILQYSREAINLDPEHGRAHGLHAWALEEANDLDGAEHEYYEALRIDPNDECNLSELGVFLKNKRKDYDGATHLYRTAIRTDPTVKVRRVNLGKLLHELKDHDGAEREWRAALRIDPHCLYTWCNLGGLLLEVRNDHEGAELQFRSALRIDPNDAGILWGLHHTLIVKGDFEGAMHAVHEFIRCGGHPEIDGEGRLAELQALAVMHGARARLAELRQGLFDDDDDDNDDDGIEGQPSPRLEKTTRPP